jgi:hypothetical protein
MFMAVRNNNARNNGSSPFEGLKEPEGSVEQTALSGSQIKPPDLPGDTYCRCLARLILFTIQ